MACTPRSTVRVVTTPTTASCQRAVAQAAGARAALGHRPARRRRHRPRAQAARAHQGHPEAAVRAVVGARDPHPGRVRAVPRPPRQGLRLPVPAVPHGRVPAGQQEPGHDRRLRPRRGAARPAVGRSRRAQPLRRLPAPPRAPRPRRARRGAGSRLSPSRTRRIRGWWRCSAASTPIRTSTGRRTRPARSSSTSRRASSSGGSGTSRRWSASSGTSVERAAPAASTSCVARWT